MELGFCALEESRGRGAVNWIDEIIWVLKKKWKWGGGDLFET